MSANFCAAKRSRLAVFVPAALLVGLPAIAQAQTVVNGPDDICAPTADPCIIDQVYDVQPPGNLSFGARTLRWESGGKLLGSVGISAGDIEILTGTTATAIDSSEAGGEAGTISLFSSGTMTINGKLSARGNPGGDIDIDADNLIVNARLLADGSPIGSDGGTVFLRSTTDILVTDEIVTKSQKGNDYDSPSGGAVYMAADGNITVTGALESGGGTNGGIVDLDAEGTLVVGNDVTTTSGGGLSYARGGYIYLYSDLGMVIQDARLAANGTTGYYVSPYGYNYAYPGYGGTHYFSAGGDLEIDKTAKLYANGGPGGGGSNGGWLFAISPTGSIRLDGDFTAKGYGKYGYGGYMFLTAYYGVTSANTSSVDLRSKTGGYASVYADYEYGDLHLDGTIDVRGRSKSGNGEYSNYGSGGTLLVRGRDMVMDGKMLQGADGDGSSIDIEVCRIHLENKAKIDASSGSPLGGGSVYISVEESFIADSGSTIKADAQGGGDVFIWHRSEKPPVLNGNIEPSPTLVGSAGGGCPVCGNSEIDAGESCDDGNLSNGDNCNDECQDEGCIAATPGYPGNPLCDDGDACTVDICDPVGHSCSNVVSCEEGVPCTVDACVASACEHTPVDALCDDYNGCTDDMCNAATGCVHANLDAVPCEDGDLCTVTGDCVSGTCVATDEVLSSKNKLSFRLRLEPDADKMSYKGELPLADYTANPAVTGMTIEVRDSNNQAVVSAVIPNTSFVDKDGTGSKISFRDKDHLLPTGGGVSQIKINEVAAKAVAKVKIRVDDVSLTGTDQEYRMSVSMLFGSDPAVDDCLTARFVPCTPKPLKNKCKDP